MKFGNNMPYINNIKVKLKKEKKKALFNVNLAVNYRFISNVRNFINQTFPKMEGIEDMMRF